MLNYLPHRPPFLFVDSIDEVHLVDGYQGTASSLISKSFVGSYAIGNFHVREDLEILKGHFPGNPILPGVVQVEMGAQVCPFIFVRAFENEMYKYDLNVALLGVDKSRFRKPIIPGMNLKFKGELVKARGPHMNFLCEIECEGDSLSICEVFASLKFVNKEEKNHE